MIAISNTGLANLGLPPVNMVGYAPVNTYVADYTANTITVTNNGVYPSGDGFGHCNVIINDNHGGTVKGVITADNGNTGALSIAGLVLTDDLFIQTFETTDLGCIAAGLSPAVNPGNLTCSVGNYQLSFTTSMG